mgnify:CR=1 FL=1
MAKYLKWRTWNDQLSLAGIILIPSLWVLNHWIALPSEVIGATIVTWALLWNFYFRKAPAPDVLLDKPPISLDAPVKPPVP